MLNWCSRQIRPAQKEPFMSSRPVPRDSHVRLWTGENPALHDALLEQLQSAGIPYVDRPFGSDQVAPTADPLPIDWRPRFGFEVAVPSRHLSQARQILEKLLDQAPPPSGPPQVFGPAAIARSASS